METKEEKWCDLLCVKPLHMIGPMVAFLMSFCMVLILWGFKGALSGLRPFLAAVSFLKMMKNTFHFTLKALFVLKIFKFLSCVFGHVAKLLDKKDKVDFRFYDVTAWLINDCNTYIPLYLEK